MRTVFSKLFSKNSVLGIACLLVILCSSCQQDRLICSYVARNKLVERSKGTMDTIKAPEIFHFYDRDNLSYFEMGMFNHKGKSKLILANDLFNDISRFHLFQEYKRTRTIYDKYERVHYVTLDSAEVADFMVFYRKVKRPVQTAKGAVLVDYNFSKEAFITMNLLYESADKNGMYAPKVTGITLWLNGRRTDFEEGLFIWKMQIAASYFIFVFKE